MKIHPTVSYAYSSGFKSLLMEFVQSTVGLRYPDKCHFIIHILSHVALSLAFLWNYKTYL